MSGRETIDYRPLRPILHRIDIAQRSHYGQILSATRKSASFASNDIIFSEFPSKVHSISKDSSATACPCIVKSKHIVQPTAFGGVVPIINLENPLIRHSFAYF